MCWLLCLIQVWNHCCHGWQHLGSKGVIQIVANSIVLVHGLWPWQIAMGPLESKRGRSCKMQSQKIMNSSTKIHPLLQHDHRRRFGQVSRHTSTHSICERSTLRLFDTFTTLRLRLDGTFSRCSRHRTRNRCYSQSGSWTKIPWPHKAARTLISKDVFIDKLPLAEEFIKTKGTLWMFSIHELYSTSRHLHRRLSDLASNRFYFNIMMDSNFQPKDFLLNLHILCRMSASNSRDFVSDVSRQR